MKGKKAAKRSRLVATQLMNGLTTLRLGLVAAVAARAPAATLPLQITEQREENPRIRESHPPTRRFGHAQTFQRQTPHPSPGIDKGLTSEPDQLAC